MSETNRRAEPVLLGWPLRGRIMARNSPARRVPSHGAHRLGTTFAIDLVPVDAWDRSAPWSWRALLTSEAAESFVGFGAPVYAPSAGTVVAVHDGELDHVARRSQLTLVPYVLGQVSRVRSGVNVIAGNHVVIDMGVGGPYILLAHLRRGSVRVRMGDEVHRGAEVAACGNSGNSTQPHLHVQVTDSIVWDKARGLPIAFADKGGAPVLPKESEVIVV